MKVINQKQVRNNSFCELVVSWGYFYHFNEDLLDAYQFNFVDKTEAALFKLIWS